MSIFTGDCVEVMAAMDAESVDAIVTDPPYNLGFMGKEWDQRHQHEPWAREAYRLLKPGGHLLAFGGTRTYHRLASAIEDAGWEIRDCLVWAYASGFPKSLDVSKAIDKAAGTDTTDDERWRAEPHFITGKFKTASGKSQQIGQALPGERHVYEPATDAAKRWQGWGTALKPAWEPIVMARKPLRGTVAQNVTTYGTGALNIDGTRIPSNGDKGEWPITDRDAGMFSMGERRLTDNTLGRWPGNLILTDPLFDGGVDGVVGGGDAGPAGTTVRRDVGHSQNGLFAFGNAGPEPDVGYGDTGTYSRFFLIPKAARSDREPLERGLLERTDGGAYANGEGLSGRTQVDGEWVNTGIAGRKARENLHPTVKPVELMRHLVRLVTPPGGVVLDCFLGSGTTAIAAEMEGFGWIGIEKEPEYVRIAEARLVHVQRGMGL